jgi:hypothetical protein
MAEVRYNVLAKAPVPVVSISPHRVDRTSETGRTWLIVHQSRTPAFDDRSLDRLKKELGNRLGTPRTRVERLTRGESIESFEYPSPASGPLLR